MESPSPAFLYAPFSWFVFCAVFYVSFTCAKYFEKSLLSDAESACMIMDSPQSRVSSAAVPLISVCSATGKQLRSCVQTDLGCLCLCWPQHLENVGKLEPGWVRAGCGQKQRGLLAWLAGVSDSVCRPECSSARTAVPCCWEEGGQRPGPLHLGEGLATLCYWITTIVFPSVFCQKPESLSGFPG